MATTAQQLLEFLDAQPYPDRGDYIQTDETFSAELREWVARLESVQKPGPSRLLAGLHLYLRDAAALRVTGTPPRDFARAAVIRRDDSEAAVDYSSSGWRAHAALAFTRANRFEQALAIWRDLLSDPAVRMEPFLVACVWERIAEIHEKTGDREGARAAAQSCVDLLRAATVAQSAAEPHGATAGGREWDPLDARPYECFLGVFELGRILGAGVMEEGAQCVVKWLEPHSQPRELLRFLHEAAVAINELGDAAATLRAEERAFRVAEEHRLDAPFFALTVAKRRLAHARALETDGGSAEAVEETLAAALRPLNRAAQWAKMAETYQTLARVTTVPRRREAYEHALARVRGSVDEPPVMPSWVTADKYSRPHRWAFARRSIQVLKEWDIGGSVLDIASEVIYDQGLPPAPRRRALALRVFMIIHPDAMDRPDGRREIATRLAGLGGGDASLSIVMRLATDDDVDVRVAAVKSLRAVQGPRAWLPLWSALHDPAPPVRDAALEVVRALVHPTAIRLLHRIITESTDPDAHAAARDAIGSRNAALYVDGEDLEYVPPPAKRTT